MTASEHTRKQVALSWRRGGDRVNPIVTRDGVDPKWGSGSNNLASKVVPGLLRSQTGCKGLCSADNTVGIRIRQASVRGTG